MKPGISEFSYGYAVTESLVRGSPSLAAAPVFPSLIAEGKAGGGWDVKIPMPGFMVFLQFKLCDAMVRYSAKETKETPPLAPPILRMHVRPGKRSRQHAMLLQLEAAGEIVYYVAPRFWTEADFNRHYLANAIIANSVFIPPGDIGVLDDEDHHISFAQNGADALLYSKPRRLPRPLLDGFSVLAHLRDRARLVTPDAALRTVERMTSAARAARAPRSVLASIERTANLPPLQRLGFVSRAVFEVEPLVILPR